MSFALSLLMITLISDSPFVSVMTVVIMAFVSLFRANIPPGFYFKFLLSFAFFALTTSALTVLSFSSFQTGLTKAALMTALALFFKALGSVLCLFFISTTTPFVQIVSCLQRLRIPPVLIEISALTYRFIFVLFEVSSKITKSQSSRLGYISLKSSYRSLGILISSLFIKTLNHAATLERGLQVRNFQGSLKVPDREYSYSKINVFFIILTVSSLILISILTRSLAR